MQYDIRALPKDQWKGTLIPLTTRSDSYYDLVLSPLTCDGCTVSLFRKPAERDQAEGLPLPQTLSSAPYWTPVWSFSASGHG